MKKIFWVYNPEGKTNEYITEYKGFIVTIYSDKEGKTWVYYIDSNSDDLHGPLYNKEEAMRVALIEVDYLCGETKEPF
jgi:hypothetical protein